MGSELLVIVGWLELVYFKNICSHMIQMFWFWCLVVRNSLIVSWMGSRSAPSRSFWFWGFLLGFPGCKMFVCFVTIYHESSSRLVMVDLSLLNFVMACWHSIIIGGGASVCMSSWVYENVMVYYRIDSVSSVVAAHCSVRNWECLQIHFYYGCLWQMLTVWRYESQLV